MCGFGATTHTHTRSTLLPSNLIHHNHYNHIYSSFRSLWLSFGYYAHAHISHHSCTQSLHPPTKKITRPIVSPPNHMSCIQIPHFFVCIVVCMCATAMCGNIKVSISILMSLTPPIPTAPTNRMINHTNCMRVIFSFVGIIYVRISVCVCVCVYCMITLSNHHLMLCFTQYPNQYLYFLITRNVPACVCACMRWLFGRPH